MAFTEDLSPFFSDDEFAVDVVLNSVPVKAIFDNAYARGDVGSLGMASTQPALTLASSDVPSSPRGKTCVVGSVTYKVAEHEPDGTGVSVLLLEKAS